MTFLYNVNRFNLIFYYDFYINEQFFIIIIRSTVHNFISHHKNNISMRYTTAIYTEYESISVSLVYSSFKYIFLYIFKILYAYFFLDGRPRSSSCDFSSSSCTSGTYRTSSCSSLCSWTVMLMPSGKAVCSTSKKIEPIVDGRSTTCNRKCTSLNFRIGMKKKGNNKDISHIHTQITTHTQLWTAAILRNSNNIWRNKNRVSHNEGTLKDFFILKTV